MAKFVHICRPSAHLLPATFLSCYYPTYGENHFSLFSFSFPRPPHHHFKRALCAFRFCCWLRHLFVCTLFVIALMENGFSASKREIKLYSAKHLFSLHAAACLTGRKKTKARSGEKKKILEMLALALCVFISRRARAADEKKEPKWTLGKHDNNNKTTLALTSKS